MIKESILTFEFDDAPLIYISSGKDYSDFSMA